MDLGGLTTVDCKSISLMIVDDIPINSKLLAKLLEPAGFGSIVQFNNSRQATASGQSTRTFSCLT